MSYLILDIKWKRKKNIVKRSARDCCHSFSGDAVYHILQIEYIMQHKYSLLTSFYRLWDLDGNETTSFTLRSPGVSVCWHPEDAFKVSINNQL